MLLAKLAGLGRQRQEQPDAASPHLCLETHSLRVGLPVRCFFSEPRRSFPTSSREMELSTHTRGYIDRLRVEIPPIPSRISERPMAAGDVLRSSRGWGSPVTPRKPAGT